MLIIGSNMRQINELKQKLSSVENQIISNKITKNKKTHTLKLSQKD